MDNRNRTTMPLSIEEIEGKKKDLIQEMSSMHETLRNKNELLQLMTNYEDDLHLWKDKLEEKNKESSHRLELSKKYLKERNNAREELHKCKVNINKFYKRINRRIEEDNFDVNYLLEQLKLLEEVK